MRLHKSAPDLLKLLLKLQLFQSFEAMQLKPIKIAYVFFNISQNEQKKSCGKDF